MVTKSKETSEISVLEISQGTATFQIIGRSPMIFNRMAEKARRELLMPKGRKTQADRAQSLKHIPLEEYRNSVYVNLDRKAPTLLCFPAPAFKGAIATAALDLPGTKKTEIGRLTWVEGYSINIWGAPKLLMSVVRSADIAKTPDIRTRAILPEWCCTVSINFVRPKLNATAIGNLLAAAGITVGIGDFRQEKGKGNFGQFSLDANAKAIEAIKKAGGRDAQAAALANPECYDAESAELFSWFNEEFAKRGHRGADQREVETSEVAE